VILPTKGVSADTALLSIGADVLRELAEAKTVSRLWSDLRAEKAESLQITFDWFVLALDLLYMLGVVEYVAGQVRRIGCTKAEAK